jgi:cysteine-rich repeat protein
MTLKTQKIKAISLLIFFMALSGLYTFQTQKDVFSESLPIVVNQFHLEFGNVFPGQEAQKTFTVSYSGVGNGKYTIEKKYKPKPNAIVPCGYSGTISDYCQEHHDDLVRCYRYLCPFIDVSSKEGEGDVMTGASVSATDLTDIWTVFLKTPAITGKVAQDYNGSIVSESGDYGCDLSFNVDASSKPICGNGKLEAGEECDDGNKIDNDECSSACKINKGSISGCKYNDKNKNGKIDCGEEKMSGWEVQLVRCPYSPLAIGTSTFNKKTSINLNPAPGLVGFCSVSATTKTGADGCYSFANLDPGDYGVNEIGESGWSQTLPSSDSYYYFNLTAGKDIKDVNFLNYQEPTPPPAPVCGNSKVENGEECDDGNKVDNDGCSNACKINTGSISGCKYNDKNGNGKIDCGEEKLPGFEIQLVRCTYTPMTSGASTLNKKSTINSTPGSVGGCVVSAVTTTGTDGCYSFTNLTAGDYGINESGKTDWAQTLPASDSYYFFNLGIGQNAKDINFLNHHIDNPPPTPTCTSWTYSDWSTCSGGKQTRTVLASFPCGCSGGNPVLTQDCTNPCTSWTYSDWSACSNGKQTRTYTAPLPAGCSGGSPITSQDCTETCSTWTYSSWGDCINGKQTRTYILPMPAGCTGGNPIFTQDCTNTCTSWTYSDWGACVNGQQIRNYITSFPNGCMGGNPVTSQTCSNGGGGGCGGGGGLIIPLTITNEKVFDVTETGAKFTWLTNKKADSRVVCGEMSITKGRLGSKPDYGYDFSSSTFDTNPNITSHNINIFQLKPNTVYYCRVISSIRTVEVVSTELSFRTLTHEIITPPTQISNLYIYDLTLQSIKTCEASFKWKTNINGTTCVVYAKASKFLGEKPKYGYDWNVAGCWDLSKQKIDHASIIGGLSPCTTYYFRLTSTNGTLDAVTEEQQVKTLCQAKSTYFPRTYIPSTSTTKPAALVESTGEVQAAQTEKTPCPTCEKCAQCQDAPKTIVEKERYMSSEDWFILLLILIVLILLINALMNRNRRKQESGQILGGGYKDSDSESTLNSTSNDEEKF